MYILSILNNKYTHLGTCDSSKTFKLLVKKYIQNHYGNSVTSVGMSSECSECSDDSSILEAYVKTLKTFSTEIHALYGSNVIYIITVAQSLTWIFMADWYDFKIKECIRLINTENQL